MDCVANINTAIGAAIAVVGKAALAREAGLGHTILRPFGTPRWNPTLETAEKLYAAAIRILSDQASHSNNSQRETEGAVSLPVEGAAEPGEVAA